MSPSRTGPFTLRMIRRFWSSRNLTRTCVTCRMEKVEADEQKGWGGSDGPTAQTSWGSSDTHPPPPTRVVVGYGRHTCNACMSRQNPKMT